MSKTPRNCGGDRKKSGEDTRNSLIAMKCNKLNLCSGSDDHLQQHIFGINENAGGGNCLFWALDQCKLEDSLGQRYIRCRIVDYAIDDENWPHHCQNLISQHAGEIKEFRNQDSTEEELKNAYRKYMERESTYGTTEELLMAAIIWNFNFSILQVDCGKFGSWFRKSPELYHVMNFALPDTGCGAVVPWFYFRFSGNPSRGHWEKLAELCLPIE